MSHEYVLSPHYLLLGTENRYPFANESIMTRHDKLILLDEFPSPSRPPPPFQGRGTVKGEEGRDFPPFQGEGKGGGGVELITPNSYRAPHFSFSLNNSK